MREVVSLLKIPIDNFKEYDMSKPRREKIVSAQKELIEIEIQEITLEEALHTCWACFKGLGQPSHTPQRAHIVSSQNGGGDEPSNFFLLCRNCHKEQPDGNSFEMQLMWLINQPHIIERNVNFSKEVIDFINQKAKNEFEDPEKILEEYYTYISSIEKSKQILNQAILKASSNRKTNRENNIKYWMLDHFKTWVKLKKMEGSFTN